MKLQEGIFREALEKTATKKVNFQVPVYQVSARKAFLIPETGMSEEVGSRTTFAPCASLKNSRKFSFNSKFFAAKQPCPA